MNDFRQNVKLFTAIRRMVGYNLSPPRKTRFGGPLALSKVRWVRPELVAEITYLSWSEDGLLRHTVFVGLREDKPANEVRREAPAPLDDRARRHKREATSPTRQESPQCPNQIRSTQPPS